MGPPFEGGIDGLMMDFSKLNWRPILRGPYDLTLEADPEKEPLNYESPNQWL